MQVSTFTRALRCFGAAVLVTTTTGVFAQPEKPTIPAAEDLPIPGGREDIFSPWWRGDPGTTIQAWTFDSDQSPHWVPESYDNPYGEPWMETEYHDEDWYSVWEGRSGVVQPWDNLVYLNLPNSDEPLDWKIVWIQLTWRHGTGGLIPPEFQEAVPPGELVWAQHLPLGDGWHYSVYEIWITENPDFEMITIESDHWFDQIVVDTWCAPLEPRGACCIDGECVATSSCLDCLLSGGWWYHGRDCEGSSPFQCPCQDALWHNGEPDLETAIACQRGPDNPIEAWVVDDVTFAEPVLIRQLHWWAATEFAYDWQNDCDIIILDDDGPDGGPGTVLVEMWDRFGFRDDTCVDMQGSSTHYYRTGALQIPLSAGTYWIGIRPVDQSSDGMSYHMTSATGEEVVQGCYVRSEDVGIPDWTRFETLFGVPHDLAFCVNGEPLQPGACCADGACTSNAYEPECEAIGGLWYESQNCADFECPCTSDSIWENGLPNNEILNALASSRSAEGPVDSWTVDDVTFGQSVFIEELHWWARTASSFDWQNRADLIILDADGPAGGPGTILVEMWDLPNTRIFTGHPDHPVVRPEYYYAIEGLNISLPAGTYWFGIRPVDEGDSLTSSYHMTTSPNDTNECYFKSEYYGVDEWTSSSGHWGVAYHLAFCVTGTAEDCPADFDGSGSVDVGDLLHLLACWADACGDLNGDGSTDVTDLLELLGDWGPCG